jgi:hypothetical protein
MRQQHRALLEKIENRAKINEVEEDLKKAIANFDEGFKAHG